MISSWMLRDPLQKEKQELEYLQTVRQARGSTETG